MRVRLTTILAFWLALNVADAKEPVVPACPSLDACMAWLDARMPDKDDGRYTDLCDPGKRALRPFGAEAKERLLAKLGPTRDGWGNFAACVLQDFPGLSESDVPRLRESLHVRHGGWEANALGRIGTPAAIEALIEDLPHGAASQTGGALKNLGQPALPYLLDFMTKHAGPNDNAFPEAMEVITQMGPGAASAVGPWSDIAADERESIDRRLAALRGLEAMGTNARSAGHVVAPLLQDKRSAIRFAAERTVLALRDPSALEPLVSDCPPVDAAHDAWAQPGCLVEIARFGDVAEPYGPQIVKHLHAGSGFDRAYAATTLGMIGYRPATADLLLALRSDDWRLVLASARSLGWLKAPEAAAALDDVTQHHWLGAVREAARVAVRSVRGEAESVPSYNWGSRLLVDSNDPFDFDSAPFRHRETRECASETWTWSGGEASAQHNGVPESKMQMLSDKTGLRYLHAFHEVENGTFLGADGGEWGGALWFQPKDGARVKLFGDNIVDVNESANGIIALTGVAHIVMNYGYVLSIKPQGTGYSVQEQIALPGAPRYMIAVGGGEYLIVTTVGGYVLHSGWRMDEAHCKQ